MLKKHIAFLRAINVGGTKIIKMEDLRKLFQSFGFANIQTYIQSGNVIFEAKESAGMEATIEEQLEMALGYKVEVFLRTMEQVTKIARQPAFEPQGDQTLHIVFLRKMADKKTEQNLLSHRSEADDFIVKGREVYNLRRDRDKSVFSNKFIEKILNVSATTRNLTTIRKIVEKYK